MAAAVQQFFGTSSADQWLGMSGVNNMDEGGQNRAKRRQHARQLAARSKSGTWGPTHSDTDDSSLGLQETIGQASAPLPSTGSTGWFSDATKTPYAKDKSETNCNGTESTKSTKSSHSSSSRHARPTTGSKMSRRNQSRSRSASNAFPAIPLQRIWSNAASTFSCQGDTTLDGPLTTRTQSIIQYVEEACSPCQPRTLEKKFGDSLGDVLDVEDDLSDHQPSSPPPVSSPPDTRLGIEQMESPAARSKASKKSSNSNRGSASKPASTGDRRKNGNSQNNRSNEHSSETSTSSSSTPLERRRQRYLDRQLRVPPPSSNMSGVHEAFEVTPEEVLYKGPTLNGAAAGAGTGARPGLPPSNSKAEISPAVKVPVDTLTVKSDEAYELQHSISELTMKSSYAEATAKLAENRRMAYYAVGRHHRNSGRGGNRRCYFTGRLILGGAPFYAGSVQQGLRTLVVFCLPSAIGLPKGNDLKLAMSSDNSLGRSSHHRKRGGENPSLGHSAQLTRPSVLSRRGSKLSRLSGSIDDMSLSVEEEMDANYGIDRDYLLSVLPDPSQGLLDEMASRYPAQFETLPVQVRSPHCWRLYVKFCFFSGLPIAEGELHYKVRDEISDAYGEEIILSHEVMETVNGDSAEILRLPNLKTFRYLRKHYSQQSGKLPDQAFMRQSWEMVRPEV